MGKDKKVKIGAVSYLNTKPLVYQLEKYLPNLELVFDLPSRLADKLATGALDVALIPSIETLQNDSYSILSDACIACCGPVWSVRLLSRIPFEDVQQVAMDEGSRTSAAMVHILFDLKFGRTIETSNLPMTADPYSVDTDAVLIIGDRAMGKPSSEFPYDWDLGEQWNQQTGLPFVFAMWTARREQGLNAIGDAIGQARDAGLAAIENIAAAEANHYGLSQQQCLTYLKNNLHFQLGTREQEGLALFRQHAVRLGLAPKEVGINLYACNAS